MLSTHPESEIAGGISVEQAFSWTPEIAGLAIGLLGLGLCYLDPVDWGFMGFGVMLITIAFVVLWLRFLDRRHRWRVVAFPKRNYAEIFSGRKSPEQVPFSSISILVYSIWNTFYETFLAACLTIGAMLMVLKGLTPVIIGVLFGAAWLASVWRTRVLLRVLLLPKTKLFPMGGRMLITKSKAKELGLRIW